MEDEAILEKLSNRDQSGLDEISEKYGKLIRKICRGILKSPQDVEEVENDVLLAVWEGLNREKCEKPDSLVGYICKIARRRAINKLRYNTAAARNSDLLTELDECLPSGFSPEDAAEKAELAEALNAWLNSQSEKHQRLFILRYFNMCSVKETAKACAMSKTAVTTSLARLRGSLKKYLTEMGMLYD